ncbi:MipA/OmpV family protein [Paludibacterium purpuratum]|uniref:Outer membrane scaffolding protein for murein synthesis (MipA/OmpV family) n=1 Tax=Paludibacterium purpuratum TaxID=1144873 RepID=A0A4R7B7L1_9NEIS|nr:MipA/OmpV family protein [Paludibacterium purpuratum]TDR79706.1 outer membrane scaffolding protein for murein synthesis (MipA/OmpV family) [Paludibacterium purpuratum]
MHYPLALILSGLSTIALAAAPAGLVAVPSSGEQRPDAKSPDAVQPDWTVSAGAGVGWLPEVMGGRYYRAQWQGQLSVVHRSGWFLDSEEGLGKRWQLTPAWSVALLLAASDKRAQSSRIDRNTTLDGMGDIGQAAQAGVALGFEQGNWHVKAKYLSSLKHDQKGQQLSLGVDYTVWRRSAAVLTLNSGLSAGDGDTMQRWFGVSAEQAARTSFAAYRASGGLSQGLLGATLTVPLDKHWQFEGRAAYVRMLGDSANSPLVKQRGYGVLGGAMQYSW